MGSERDKGKLRAPCLEPRGQGSREPLQLKRRLLNKVCQAPLPEARWRQGFSRCGDGSRGRASAPFLAVIFVLATLRTIDFPLRKFGDVWEKINEVRKGQQPLFRSTPQDRGEASRRSLRSGPRSPVRCRRGAGLRGVRRRPTRICDPLPCKARCFPTSVLWRQRRRRTFLYRRS